MKRNLDQLSFGELGELFPIILIEPNHDWKNVFLTEKMKLLQVFQGASLAINHIGSTAIPDLIAKPTIDILLEVSESLDTRLIIKLLKEAGYHYIYRPDNPAPHMMFVKGYTIHGFEGQTFHVHVRYFGEWDEITFRDYLIKFPIYARKYANLKIRLSKKFKNDREGYTLGKTKFIEQIIKKARKEFNKLSNKEISQFMTMNRMDPRVDEFISNAGKWKEEFEKLRMIVLDCQLNEELKWGVPCYTFQKRNILLIHGFKEYCALLFFKGALLHDASGILIIQTKNTQASRQIRFTSVREIAGMETILKAYIYEAIEVEKAGLKVSFKKTAEFIIPEEFQKKLDESPALRTAFHALTPGRQRAYILYFSAPKQSKTRESRVEKSMHQILIGKGLNDQ